MTTAITMLQTRRGEDGTLWTVGNSYAATDNFAAILISGNVATGTLPRTPGSVVARFAEDSSGNVTGLVSPRGVIHPIRAELGNYFPKRLRRATYGRKVASWGSALQNSVGTTSFVTGDLPPFADNATRVVRVDQNAAVSFAQQNPIDGSQSYMPLGRGLGPLATPTTGGFSVGVWVKNPGNRTLNFYLQMYNIAANRSVLFNAAIEPSTVFQKTNGWAFVTVSSLQDTSGNWQRGVDSVNFVRVAQRDSLAEGAWVAGEYLLFGNVYVDVKSRPRFMLTFDDGVRSQRHPGSTSKVSGTAFVSSTLTNTLTTAAAHALVIGEPLQFGETPPTSLVAGTTYWVSTVPSTTTFTLTTDEALTTPATTTAFSGTARYQYAGPQDRSVQQVVESYGFRGTLFIVDKWLGTSGKYGFGGSVSTFLSAEDVIAMWNEGWAIGSHSSTHPANNENAGLRLLGPYGYFLSNTFDNLPAQYLTNFSLTSVTGRRRITAGTQASPSVFTAENAHQFLVNSAIVFTDVAPTGCVLGTIYYVASIPSGTTFTLATDQGTLLALVNNTTGAWSGTANYRHPGSANDDSAIYADIETCIASLSDLGINTGRSFFALPQGASDTYVRSASVRASLGWVRGISTIGTAHTIPVGVPSGSGVNNFPNGGWMGQLDCAQTDGTLALSALTGYVDETIVQGACGCSYHHGLLTSNLVALNKICAHLRTKADAGLIDVITCDELKTELGF